jgi:hypothetical protein
MAEYREEQKAYEVCADQISPDPAYRLFGRPLAEATYLPRPRRQSEEKSRQRSGKCRCTAAGSVAYRADTIYVVGERDEATKPPLAESREELQSGCRGRN